MLSFFGEMRQLEIEKHHFIRHGSFEINTIFYKNVTEFTLDNLRHFIVSRSLEGLVFHFPGVGMFKVNRGHIGVEISKDEMLRISVKE